MRVGTNISALTANNTLKKTDNALTKSMERLSSGLKVNHAKDIVGEHQYRSVTF